MYGFRMYHVQVLFLLLNLPRGSGWVLTISCNGEGDIQLGLIRAPFELFDISYDEELDLIEICSEPDLKR